MDDDELESLYEEIREIWDEIDRLTAKVESLRPVAHWIGMIENDVYNNNKIDRDVLAKLVAWRHDIIRLEDSPVPNVPAVVPKRPDSPGFGEGADSRLQPVTGGNGNAEGAQFDMERAWDMVRFHERECPGDAIGPCDLTTTVQQMIDHEIARLQAKNERLTTCLETLKRRFDEHAEAVDGLDSWLEQIYDIIIHWGMRGSFRDEDDGE